MSIVPPFPIAAFFEDEFNAASSGSKYAFIRAYTLYLAVDNLTAESYGLNAVLDNFPTGQHIVDFENRILAVALRALGMQGPFVGPDLTNYWIDFFLFSFFGPGAERFERLAEYFVRVVSYNAFGAPLPNPL